MSDPLFYNKDPIPWSEAANLKVSTLITATDFMLWLYVSCITSFGLSVTMASLGSGFGLWTLVPEVEST